MADYQPYIVLTNFLETGWVCGNAILSLTGFVLKNIGVEKQALFGIVQGGREESLRNVYNCYILFHGGVHMNTVYAAFGVLACFGVFCAWMTIQATRMNRLQSRLEEDLSQKGEPK